MGTTFIRVTMTLRILTFASLIGLTGFLGFAGTSQVAADETGVVDEGCAVPELYPNEGIPCVPSTDDPVPGGDEPVCYAPAGELDCGPDTIDDGDCQDPDGCSVPGDPGSGGCDPATSDCGTGIEVPPPVEVDPGEGDDEPVPCPQEWTVEGGCVIPIGTLPGEGDPGGDPAPCPDGGKSCAVPEPAPIVGVEVSGGAANERLTLTGAAENAGTDLPADTGTAPVDDAAVGICSASCNVTSGLPSDESARSADTTVTPGDPSRPSFGVSPARLDPVQARVSGTPAAVVIETLLIWLRAFLLP